MAVAASAPPALDAEFRPPSPLRLPARGGDRVLRVGSAVGRLLHVDGAAVVVRAWSDSSGSIRVRAEPVGEGSVSYPHGSPAGARGAGREDLERAIDRARFMLWLDDDLTGFYRRFRGDSLIGQVVRRKPWLRPRRRPWPWEALAWAITEQLIEASRAAEIQRRIVRAWGPSMSATAPPASSPARTSRDGWRREGRRPLVLTDVPGPAAIAARAPAELVSMDLTEARSLAMIRCAREVAAGRARLDSSAADARLLAIREIGPWTVQCLGLRGRGDPDALPAGDLAYVKLVGRLAGLGRRATVEEVEEFFAPYAPYRGLAGHFALIGAMHRVQGAPLGVAA